MPFLGRQAGPCPLLARRRSVGRRVPSSARGRRGCPFARCRRKGPRSEHPSRQLAQPPTRRSGCPIRQPFPLPSRHAGQPAGHHADDPHCPGAALSFEPPVFSVTRILKRLAVLSPDGLPSIPAIDSGPPGWRFPFASDLPPHIRLLILPIPFLCTATWSQTAPRCPILNIHSRFRTKSGDAHGLCPNSSTPKWQT
jgi:hypothetical protein